MPDTTYRVECEGHDGPQLAFPGLTFTASVARCEAERGKARWASILIRSEATGAVLKRYGGGAAVVPQGGAR